MSTQSSAKLDRLQKGTLWYAGLLLLVIALLVATGAGRVRSVPPTAPPRTLPIPSPTMVAQAPAAATAAGVDLLASPITIAPMPPTPPIVPRQALSPPAPTPVPTAATMSSPVPLPVQPTLSPSPVTATPGPAVALAQDADALARGMFRDTALGPDGTLTLAPAVADDFSGAVLDPDTWRIVPWSPGGTAVLYDDTLSVNVAALRTVRPFIQRTLVVRARFTAGPPPYQNIAWSPDLNGPTAILIGEPPGDPAHVYARLKRAGEADRLVPLSVTFGADHTYAITWEQDHIDFAVDGTLVATIDAVLDTPMYAWISSATAGHPLTAAWARVLDYAATEGSFASASLDAGMTVMWRGVAPDGTIPAGTAITVLTRTSADGATWSAYEPLAMEGEVTSPPGRYLQYELILQGTAATSPVIRSVAVSRSAVP